MNIGGIHGYINELRQAMIQLIKVLKFQYNDWNGLINDIKRKVKQAWNSKWKWVNMDRRKENEASIDAMNEKGPNIWYKEWK